MNAADTNPSFWLFLTIVVLPLLGAAALVKLGRFPRRRGQTPHCRRCNYTLTGLVSDRCPECGSTLTDRTIVHGERPRRPALTALGAFLLLVALANTALFFIFDDQIDWYRYKPTDWVVNDAADPAAAVAVRAWDELTRRRQAGGLTELHEQRLTEIALREQASPTPGPIGQQLLNYLGARAADGKLSDQQKQRFIDQGMSFTLTARPRIALGDRIPYRVAYKGRGAGYNLNWRSSFGVRAIRINGRPIPMQGSTTTSTMFGGGMSSAIMHTQFAEPGTHTLEADLEHDVAHTAPFAKTLKTLRATFTILPDRPDDLVRLVPNESLRPFLSNAITLQSVVRERNGLMVNLNCLALPTNVAFEVIGRVGNREFPVGTVSLPKNTSMGYGMSVHPKDPPASGPITIILRASDRVARESVDLYDAWDGELVYQTAIKVKE